MKAMRIALPRLVWFVALVALSVSRLSAQDEEPGAAAALVGGAFLLFVCIIALAAYVYMALALQTIAQKTNTQNGWLAWIPIANIVLMLNIARKPVWWILLCLIPLVNIIIIIMIWMGVAEARGKPGWLGILMIVPLANLIVPGYLAWSD
jgi:hypothetical protein